MQAFTKMSSTNWLFNEGFYLHSRITTSIFDSDAPFLFFHSIGWGKYLYMYFNIFSIIMGLFSFYLYMYLPLFKFMSTHSDDVDVRSRLGR